MKVEASLVPRGKRGGPTHSWKFKHRENEPRGADFAPTKERGDISYIGDLRLADLERHPGPRGLQ